MFVVKLNANHLNKFYLYLFIQINYVIVHDFGAIIQSFLRLLKLVFVPAIYSIK